MIPESERSGMATREPEAGDTAKGSASEGDDLHLVQHRPVLAGDDETLRSLVVRDAVQHVLGTALGRGIDVRRVDPADHLAVTRIDACDPILVPDVRPDLDRKSTRLNSSHVKI